MAYMIAGALIMSFGVLLGAAIASVPRKKERESYGD